RHRNLHPAPGLAPAPPVKPKLTLFDLDHTLLSGDSDVLWCDFLMDKGLLARAEFAPRNADMEARYQAGTVGAQEFADFYVGTLAGKGPAQWEPARQEFLATRIVPRIPPAAIDLVQKHLDAGDLVAMTTATNRFITELTALYLGVEHLLATEAELVNGLFTGRVRGTLNMRAGKVARLHEWLAARGHSLAAFRSKAYSDSINDLPLLEAVDKPVAVDPDPRLAAIARERGWRVLNLHAGRRPMQPP
ncbi:MAG: HAD family hydrolase, partial [Ramlibacter sp.]